MRFDHEKFAEKARQEDGYSIAAGVPDVPKVFWVTEDETVVAFDAQQARDFHKSLTGEDVDEAEFREFTDAEMAKRMLYNAGAHNAEHVTYSEGLRRALAEGCKVPFGFTSTNW